MPTLTVAVPVTHEGAVFERLAQAPLVAVCHLDDGAITDWTEYEVGWDTTYGVDVLGNHHARAMRFVEAHGVTTVIASDVCDSMQRSLAAKGVQIHAHQSGDARTAVREVLAPAPA